LIYIATDVPLESTTRSHLSINDDLKTIADFMSVTTLDLKVIDKS